MQPTPQASPSPSFFVLCTPSPLRSKRGLLLYFLETVLTHQTGALLHTSLVSLPSLSVVTSSRDLALALEHMRSRMHRPLVLVASASGAAYAFLAYYLYTAPPILLSFSSLAIESCSLHLCSEVTEVIAGAGWGFYATAAAAVGAVLALQTVEVAPAEKRIQQADEGLAEAEERKLTKTSVADAYLTEEDLDSWQKALGVKGALAAVGAVFGAYAAACW